MRAQRGFTIPEMMVSLIILGLMFVAIGALAGPIMSAPSAGSAKTDTVGSAAYGLDGIERDIRQSDAADVWSCTKSVTVTCTQPTALTASPYVAMLTAYDSSGLFHADPSGSTGPKWQAYIVYSQPAGSSIIYRTYLAWITPPSSPLAGAVAAVTAASLLPSGTTVAVPNAQSMSLGINSQISFQLVSAAGSGPAANSTTYTTTILARN